MSAAQVRRFLVFLVTTGGILLAPNFASAASDLSFREQGPREHWPFEKGRIEVGVQTGGGITLQSDSRSGTAFALLPRVGYIFHEITSGLPPSSLEIVAQPLYLRVFQDQAAHVGGLAFLLKHNFLTRTKFTPFVNIGAGGTYTTHHTASLGSHFNFALQAGVGVQYAIGDRHVLSFEWLYQHLSNAYIYERNPGLDLGLFLLGFSALY